jgi:MFS family permease
MVRGAVSLRYVGGAFSGLPREVTVLAAVAAAVGAGFTVVGVALPQFAHSFGVGKTAVGAVFSAFALMRFVSAPWAGRLVDRAGERVILTTGIGIVAVSTGLAGLSQSYPQLLILRGAGGIGSAMFTVAAVALLLRVVGAGSRGRATGMFQSGFLIGGLLGPTVGGYLTGYSLRLPFYVYAVSLIVAGSISAVYLSHARLAPRSHPTPDEPAQAVANAESPSVAAALEPEAAAPAELSKETAADAGAQSTTLAEAWAHPAYRAAVAVNFAVGWAFFGIRTSLVPLFVTEAMNRDLKWVGVGFTLTAVAQTGCLLVAGRFVDRRGRRPAMVLGSLVSAAALVALSVSKSLGVFIAVMVVLGVGGAFLGTAPGAVVGDIMRGSGGRVVAVFQMASDGGSITGPLLAGVLADAFSFGTAFAACAAVLVLAAALSARMPETLPMPDASPVPATTPAHDGTVGDAEKAW